MESEHDAWFNLETELQDDSMLDLSAPAAPQVEEAAPEPTTEAIARNVYDNGKFQEVLAQTESLQAVIERGSRQFPLTESLVADVFHALHLPFPREQDVAPRYQKVAEAVRAMRETADYAELHALTALDAFGAGLAASGVAEAVLKEVLKEEEKHPTPPQPEPGDGDQTQNDQGAPTPQGGRSSPGNQGNPNPDTGDGAGTSEDGNENGQAPDQQSEQGHNQAPQQQQTQQQEEFAREVRIATKAAMQQAKKRLDAYNEAIEAFGGLPNRVSSNGWNPGAASLSQNGNFAERAALAREVLNNPKLRAIMRHLGRFQVIAERVQRSKIEDRADEITGITMGSDLPLVLPSEFVRLAVEELELLFIKDYVMDSLLQYDVQGKERQAKGPVIVAIDESGSMEGDKIAWAMAVLMTIISVAARQKRDLLVLHYSDATVSYEPVGSRGGSNRVVTPDLLVERFVKGKATPQQVINTVLHFFNGGTNYTYWMQAALEAIQSSTFKKADVLHLTDGICPLDPETITRWNETKRAKEFRCVTVLFEQGVRAKKTVEQFSDEVFDLSDLHRDVPVLERAFSI